MSQYAVRRPRRVMMDQRRARAFTVSPAIILMSMFLASCEMEGGDLVSVDETPEDRWESLDPVATVVTAPSSGSTPEVGTVVADPVTVRVTDRKGRPFAYLPVWWTVSDPTAGASNVNGGDRFSTSLLTVLDSNGESSVRWRVGTVAGDQSITATILGPGLRRYKRIRNTFETAVDPGAPDQLEVSPSRAELEIDDEKHLNAHVTDEYGNQVNETVRWSSADEAVATVDGSGMVIAAGSGVAIISASVANLTEEATIEVEGAPGDTTTVVPGDTTTVVPGDTTTVVPGDTTTVVPGDTTTVVPGDTTTVIPGDTATAPLGSLVISPGALYPTVGQTAQLTVNALDGYGDVITPLISWESSNPSVAQVDGTGRVTAVNAGTATIEARNACCETTSIQVTVQEVTSSEELDWFCDWRHDTGPSNEALFGHPQGRKPGDTSPPQCFDSFAATGGYMLDSVTTATGKGFPLSMQNVLNIYWDSDLQPGGGSMQVGHKSGTHWSEPQVGEYIYYRIYDKSMRAPGSRINAHMIHMGTNETHYIGRWFTNTAVASDGTYNLAWQTWLPSGQGRGAGSFAPKYQTDEQQVNHVYRREWRAHRFHPDSVRWQLRVYDENGALFQTGADYLCGAGDCQNAGGRMADTLGAYAHAVPSSHWDGFQGLEIGNNGSENGDPSAVQHWYWGGYAVRVTNDPNGWIGAYPSASERN